ncbi:MAG: S-layer homology domain-containing protein [Oscillospiraceae bacterium]|nr:S-layer homology domain-containing protein [Oscillospiraceae bacterium]
MDGRQFRCRISQGADYVYTRTATLTISKTPTSATLTVANGAESVVNGDTVQSSSSVSEDIIETILEWNSVTKTDGGKTYTMMATSEEATTDANGVVTDYTYTAPYFWVDESGKLYAVDAGNAIGAEYTDAYRVFHDRKDDGTQGDLAVETSATLTTGLPEVEIATDIKSTSGYKVGDTYVYVAEVTVNISGENSTATKYYYKSGAEYVEVFHDESAGYIMVGSEKCKPNNLVPMQTSTVSKIVTGQNVTTVDGDKLTLSASVAPAEITGSVYFQITDLTTGSTQSVNAKKSGDKWTAEYTFPSAGVYEVKSAYNGNSVYFGSNSEPIKIYAVNASKSLSISGGAITYGSSLNLAPVIVSKDGKSPVTSDNAVTYTVKRDGKENSGLISKNMFTPTEVGNYTVTATYNDGTQDYTASVAIKVHPKTVQIAAQPAKASLRDDKATREAQLVATVTGITSADTHLLKYSVTSDATTAVANGNYRIDVKVDSDVRAELEKKYSLVLTPGVFTLEQGSVRVYAEAVSNGSVNISYTTTVSDSNGTYTSSPLRVESGTLLPIGADVTVTAAPNAGFGVEKWVVDGKNKAGGNLNYTIDNLQQACNIQVYFTQTFNTLNFDGTPGGGSVIGTYAGGNSVFNSGDSINLNQSVVLTAVPSDGYVVAGWTRNGESVMADNGTSFFTGNKITVDHVSETVNYFVTFEKKEQLNATVKLVDKSGAPVAGGSVNINQQNVAGTDNVFTLNTHNHANLDIKVTVPDNMLIDHWELNGQVVANAVDELTVYDLVSSAEYTVICVTPNQRGLTFGTELIGTNGGTVAEAGTITATRSGNAITSGTNVPQGAVVNFTAKPSDGFRIAKWTVGAYQVAGEGVESYQLTMDQNAEVKVHFEKKPTIVLDNGSGGNANLQVGDVTSTDKETVVDFGSRIQINIVPSAGYVVDDVTVNDSAVVLTSDKDIRYFVLTDVTNNTTVKITYKAKPVVTVDNDANGEVTMSATRDFTEGEITSGSYIDFGSDIEAEISPVKGYVIDNVTVNTNEVTLTEIANSDNKSFTISDVQENTAIAVTYKALDTTSVTFSVIDKNDAEAGGLNGTLSAIVERKGMEAYSETDTTGTVSTVYEGSTVTFAPAPEAGYKVSKWFVNGEETTVAPVITVTDGMADQNILAQFDYVGEDISFAVTGAADKALLTAVFVPDGGVAQDFASGNKPAVDGTVTIIVNDLDNNYEIEGWYVNGEKQQIIAEAFDYAATVGMGADITVNIIRKSYTVNFSATEGTVNAVVSGNAIASGDLVVGDSVVTFTAEAKLPTGYSFLGWTVNGAPSDETSETLSLSVTENLTVEATYRLDAVTHQVTYGVVDTNGETDGGMNGVLTLKDYRTNPASVYAGSDISFTAVPDAYYRVEGWYSDAEGTMPISGTAVEQNTYDVEHITAPMSVYVKFEPIPQYTVSIDTIGLGAITATVNGEEATIENGSIIVWRYDDVVLTAVPSEHQYLSGWTVNETASGNQLSLTLTDVTENTDVTAEFMASQNIELKTEVVNGSIEIKAGFGDQLEYINPETGIVIHKGQNVELTVTPDSGMMVDKWIVNGEEMTDYLDNILMIEAIDKDTTVRVECVEILLHNLPADDAEGRYVVTDILETPVEYGTDKQVRDRGTVTFVVESKDNNIITELQVAAGAGSRVDAKKTAVNKWDVTVENVKADIELTPTVVSGKQLEVTCGAGGKIVITKGGEVIANNSILNFGDEIVIRAEADKNYKLSSLTLNGNTISSGNTYTVVPEDERILINATFTARSSGGGGGGGGGGDATPTYIVSFETNGGSEIKSVSVSLGGKVTIPDAPTKDGYTFDGWYTDEELTTAYDFDATVSKSLTLYAKWKEFSGNSPSGWQNPFEDVKLEHWFYDDVRFVNENGLMKGVSEKLFAPSRNVTRAMLVTVLYRMEGEPTTNESSPFGDVDMESYYGNAVSWAKQNGIVKGISENEFAPNVNITREQFAAIMLRYAEYKGMSAVTLEENLHFDDADEISEYAISAMNWAVGSELIKGRSEKTLCPKDTATRAECAAILHRFFETNK